MVRRAAGHAKVETSSTQNIISSKHDQIDSVSDGFERTDLVFIVFASHL